MMEKQPSKLLKLLPPSFVKKHYSRNDTQSLYKCIQDLHEHPKHEELNEFFKEIGIEKQCWLSLDTSEDKFNYIMLTLEKNIEEGLKRLKTPPQNSSLSSIRKQKNKTNDFEWLHLKTKNQMLKEKLKVKLVQTINEFNNEKRLREIAGKQLNENQKIHLEQDFSQLQTKSIKMDYQWTEEDQDLFLRNIQKLKEKFIQTQFLKHCNRYKFISAKELATLASEEISRKLDKKNKAFLSREFLLDKYFSTKENLTENQMKFILKTSPLMTKCADKGFIKGALKNICYDDIDRMELQIAQQILTKFQTIRNLVRQSRKTYKQKNNKIAKEKIKEFENRKKQEQRQQNYRKNKGKRLTDRKTSFPIYYNRIHPANCLFVKDCNQQGNDDTFHDQETNYLLEIKRNAPKSAKKRQDMIKYYTGGPNERCANPIHMDQMKVMIEDFKSIQERNQTEMSQPITQLKTQKSIAHENIRKTCKNIEDTEKLMKEKIIKNNEKAKAQVFINKLLVSAAENTFLSFKALNAKLCPAQINRKDKKGNTALFYAIKNKNVQFVDYLLAAKGDVNIKCSEGMTPLHKVFQTNNYSLICKCLIGSHQPDLNVLDDEGNTPLAYGSRKMLQMLNLENGVVCVSIASSVRFDNNKLLQREKFDQIKEEELQARVSLGKKML